MRIALFDHVVSPRSPAGSCDLRVLRALGEEHEITVFASEIAPTSDTGAISPVIVPSVRRPALASFLLYLACTLASYRQEKLRSGDFDLVQATDCSFPNADVCYAHFCHRAFLKEVWPRLRVGLNARALHSWANHKARALIEARLVETSRVIVVPSEGLMRDFARVYPAAAEKLTVIHNTVDIAGFDRPGDFDRRPVRARMETGGMHAAFAFVALGHFERKGLPMLLEALATDTAELEHARIWVIGGEPGLVSSYRGIAERMGVAQRVVFAGKTDDVRPFLWSADAFVAPSHYEAFSLGLLEAAAAGLPLIATRISGSEELLEDGVNGLEVEPTPAGVSAGLRRFLALEPVRREAMRRAARDSVERLSPERFAAAWRALYASLDGPRSGRVQTGTG